MASGDYGPETTLRTILLPRSVYGVQIQRLMPFSVICMSGWIRSSSVNRATFVVCIARLLSTPEINRLVYETTHCMCMWMITARCLIKWSAAI